LPEQFFLVYDPSTVLNQYEQGLECLGRERNVLALAQQHPVVCIQLEGAEPV
jgi:hypothetical protein